jgi:succinyl-diaminopimelate desuccinylase
VSNHPVITLATQLLACASVTPDDATCQSILRTRLEALGFQCETMRFKNVDNLWARIGDNHPCLVFAGHTDVVPTGPETDWETPPFIPSMRDGKIYARGACDMKGAIAAMIIAVESFLKSHPTFQGAIGFLFTSDEEGDAIDGTAKVIETLSARGIKMDYCVIGEPSSNQTIGDQIRVGRRGSLHAEVTIYGKQGHVAHPHLALNPIFISASAIHELAETKWDQGNDHYPPTTFQISNLKSGTGALNVIPGQLMFNANFRYGTACTQTELQQHFEAILQKHGLNYEVNWHVSAQPFLTTQGKLISSAQQAITAITNQPVHLSTGGGTSDGRFIAPTGTEVIELGVPNLTAHHVNEWVNTNDLIQLTDMYQGILKLLLTNMN